MVNKMEFGLIEYQAEQGRIVLNAPGFDFDSFPHLGERLLAALPARVIEKQCDADIHSWLIDFEDCQMFLKAEHYSESVWFESLSGSNSQAELAYLASLFQQGFSLPDSSPF
ncbi:DUF3630 family protein [Vibrio scophthalmi]|uniref:Uncharacterized protein n=2 Tax=Vibrio scophthalmi TaxID=45658 RepID=F9RM85_9VIBR|nr:DUF3630 family protein [Vibrio scophthalmi]ANU37966.1 hypothetical protein VSVS05_02912 [Vibrio scophthalmi]EGU38612.1 hypothetical protein VIS19158_21868 [Vibrio scophthalmi LMG 19158]